MNTNLPKRLLPTIPMLAESLREAGWNCRTVLSEENQSYRGIRLYHPRQQLQKDVLYLLRPEESTFPVEEYSYLSSEDHGGRANHLILHNCADEEILDQLLEIFSQFQAWEDAIDLLLYRGASLQELCELGEKLLDNPVCIHDDWFMMTAMSARFRQVMEPEYLLSSARGFVPRAVVEDFQYDSDYLETYRFHDAQVWYTPEKDYYTLYVNLWDGPVYKGRLLVSRQNREFLRRDFLLAEVLTQRAVFLLRQKQLEDRGIHQNMDEIVFGLLKGGQTQLPDLNHLLHILHWQKTDRFLCLRLRSQQGMGTAAEHMLHSDLFRALPGGYILLDGQEQCVVMNLSQSADSVARIRHSIAPLCRDYCLYVGISSPVSGIRELPSAYYQAGAALDQAFRLRSDKWMLSFSDCAMEHILKNLPSPLIPGHLIAPELTELMAYDAEHGTPYFETLREYLLQERDIPRTSQALIIHRTTLLYRLKKIKTMLRSDLEDPWQRMYLMTSLWILEREKKK